MDQCPSSCHISSRLITGCTSKALQNILPPSILSTTGEPWAEVRRSWHWHTAKTTLSICQISSRYENLCTRYLLPEIVDLVTKCITEWLMYRGTRPEFTKTKPRLQNFVDFGDGVTDKNTHKNTKRCFRIPRGDKKLRLCLKVPEVLVLTTER